MEFRSSLEQIMSAKELLFDSTPGFGDVYKKYLGHAVAHPAKANTQLLEFLIKKYTEKGDVVLDPMAGSGSTGIVASLHGRNAVNVELEPKFWEWMEQARVKVEKQSIMPDKGKIRNVLGDARKLSEILGVKADSIVTSPPYADSEKRDRSRESWWDEKREKEKAGGSVGIAKGYQASEDNIGNLPLGEVDTVITSPPYEDGMSAKRHTLNTERRKIYEEKHWATRYGADAIIKSPPYADTNARKGRKMDLTQGIRNRAGDLPENEENIGNLTKETYLSAMLKVYSEMFKVLKPNGLAIIVIKPFIRNKRVVDLPYHTWLLLKKAGFKLVKLYKLRLKQESFWRILYHKKYPDVPEISHEYILVCQKV